MSDSGTWAGTWAGFSGESVDVFWGMKLSCVVRAGVLGLSRTCLGMPKSVPWPCSKELVTSASGLEVVEEGELGWLVVGVILSTLISSSELDWVVSCVGTWATGPGTS